MDFLNVILLIADPILVAFVVSVLLGLIFKTSSMLLFAKYTLTFLSAMGYLILYVYADGIWNNKIILYIVMFAPVVIILAFIVLACIFAPKDIEKQEFDKDKKYITGWDSMFPNDIDNHWEE